MNKKPATKKADGDNADHLGYLLTAYLFDSLSPAGKAEVESHLAACESCRAQLELLRATLGLTEQVFNDDGKTYVFETRRRQRIQEAAARARHGFFNRLDPAVLTFRSWKAMAAVAALLVLVVSVALSALVQSAPRTARLFDDREQSTGGAMPPARGENEPVVMINELRPAPEVSELHEQDGFARVTGTQPNAAPKSEPAFDAVAVVTVQEPKPADPKMNFSAHSASGPDETNVQGLQSPKNSVSAWAGKDKLSSNPNQPADNNVRFYRTPQAQTPATAPTASDYIATGTVAVDTPVQFKAPTPATPPPPSAIAGVVINSPAPAKTPPAAGEGLEVNGRININAGDALNKTIDDLAVGGGGINGKQLIEEFAETPAPRVRSSGNYFYDGAAAANRPKIAGKEDGEKTVAQGQPKGAFVPEFNEGNVGFGLQVGQGERDLQRQTELATVKKLAPYQEVAQTALSAEEEKFHQDVQKIRGVTIQQQQAAVVDRAESEKEIRARNEKAELTQELETLKQNYSALARDKNEIERDLTRQTQRIEKLIEKGVPVLTIIQEDATATQPMIKPDPETAAARTSPAAKEEASRRLGDLAQEENAVKELARADEQAPVLLGSKISRKEMEQLSVNDQRDENRARLLKELAEKARQSATAAAPISDPERRKELLDQLQDVEDVKKDSSIARLTDEDARNVRNPARSKRAAEKYVVPPSEPAQTAESLAGGAAPMSPEPGLRPMPEEDARDGRNSARNKLALSAKDDTIRGQEDLIAKERATAIELQQANKALAAQNDQLARANAESTKLNAAAVAELKKAYTLSYGGKPANALESKHDTPPSAPAVSAANGIVIPPDILERAELGDHFETINPDKPDAQSAFGNPDARMFHKVPSAEDAPVQLGRKTRDKVVLDNTVTTKSGPNVGTTELLALRDAEQPVQIDGTLYHRGRLEEGRASEAVRYGAVSGGTVDVDKTKLAVQRLTNLNYFNDDIRITPEPESKKPQENVSANFQGTAASQVTPKSGQDKTELNFLAAFDGDLDGLVDDKDEIVLFDAEGKRRASPGGTPNRNDSLYLEYPKLQTQLENVELKIHDVKDLAGAVQDFPGPDLGTSGKPAGTPNPITLLKPRLDPRFPSGGNANNDLVKHLKERFATDFTDGGTSIEERGGKLVVMNKPEVQQKIDGYLSELRTTSGGIANTPAGFKNNWHFTKPFASPTLIQGQALNLVRTDTPIPSGNVADALKELKKDGMFGSSTTWGEVSTKLKKLQPGEELRAFDITSVGAGTAQSQVQFTDASAGTPLLSGVEIQNAVKTRIAQEFANVDYDSIEVKDARLFVPARPEVQTRVESILRELRNGVAILKEAPRADVERTLRAYNFLRAESGASKQLSFVEFCKRPAPVTPPLLTDDGLDEDAYIEKHGTRPFVDAKRDHLSTFGMDVDTASYTRARSQLRDNNLPDPAAVRVEEFVNYFKQPYSVAGEEAFGVFAEAAPSPFNRGGGVPPPGSSKATPSTEVEASSLQLLKIGIKSRDPKPNERKPANLTFAVDTSGSMTRDDRLDLLRAALTSLVEQLQPDDAVSIVAFSDQAQVLLPRTQARQKQRILDAVTALHPDGGTNVEAGLALAYRMADESFSPDAVNRVILCSDGVANVGAKGPEAVLKTVKVFAGRGIDLSSVGFGMGKYNDEMMMKLADNGNGSCHFVDTLDEARRIFTQQLPPHLSALARDAKVQVEFNPAVVSRYRLLGYEKRKIADKDFRNDAIDAGEVQHSTLVTALYEIQRAPAARGPLGKVFLRWKDAGHRHLPVIERNFPLDESMQSASVESASPQLRFLACVARFAELLRNSPWTRNSSYADILDQLENLPADFKQTGEWKEVKELVQRAQTLSVQQWLKNL